MKAIISPAKTLDLETPYPKLPSENPVLENSAEILVNLLKKLSPVQIEALMSISPKLAELNYDRFKKWRPSDGNPSDDLRPAIYMFKGDVYQGIDPHTLTVDEIKKINRFTYILSGLYGILKPLTLIRPYRLEMGSKIPHPHQDRDDLYRFWGDKVAAILNQSLTKEPHPILVNLASEEYYKVVKPYLSPRISIIHPIFLDKVKGKYKIVSFYAKKARGLMIRFMIENPSDPQYLKKFNSEGYHYSDEETQKWNQNKFSEFKNQSTLVFLRNH